MVIKNDGIWQEIPIIIVVHDGVVVEKNSSKGRIKYNK